MSILKIARMGHPVLRVKGRKLGRREIRAGAIQQFVDDMMVTMTEYGGIGLAAPQVHQSLRLFIAMFNPEVADITSEMGEDWEGCLSIPEIRGLVLRAQEIVVTALDRAGDRVEFLARDLSARVIQHEYDHINGVLFVDRMRSLTSLAYLDPSSGSIPPF